MSQAGSISFSGAMGLVATAFLVGVLASLALRPPGSGGRSIETADRGAMETFVWRVHTAFNTRLPVLGEGVDRLAAALAAATGDRLRLDIFEPGELAPAFAATESVRSGKIDAAFSWVGYDQGRIPGATLLGAVPFGMEPPEYLAWWYHGGGRELGEALYAEHDVQLLLCGLIGPETAGWFRKPITSLDDLDGLKIRFSGLAGKVLQRLGASVTVLPGGEIFQALEKGAIDASEFSQPMIDDVLGFDRVARFNYFPGWHQTFSAFHLMVRRQRWEQLAPATRSLLDHLCRSAALAMYAQSEAGQGPVLAGFAAKGVEARDLPRPVLEALRAVTEAVLAEEAAADPWFERILASQRAFSSDYRRWELRAYLPREF